MKQFFKKALCVLLTVTLLTPTLNLQVFAKTDTYIPEIAMDESILTSDVFYLTAPNASLYEGANERYLLRLGRGGDVLGEAGVILKIADMTAKYGKDYTVSLLDSDEAVISSDTNESLLEMMEDSDYTESELKNEEDCENLMQNDAEFANAMTESINTVIEYLEEESGILEQEADTAAEEESGILEQEADTAAEEESVILEQEADTVANEESAVLEEDTNTAAEEGETININPLLEARSTFTGVSGEPQRVTSTQDPFKQIQDVADVITSAVVGASLPIEFSEGEKEKYIVIDVKNNSKGDGDRYFYFMLSTPWGDTTISASSSCALTIFDDEEQLPSKVSFDNNTYYADEKSVTVNVVREGALNTMVAVKLTTASDTLVKGRDFSHVDMEVVFPMGIDKREIKIPVRKDYVSQQGSFEVKLSEAVGCDLEAESATVFMYRAKSRGASAFSLEEGSAAKSGGVTANRSLGDIVLGEELNIAKPDVKGNTSHYKGRNSYNSTEEYYRMVWKDDLDAWDHFWRKYKKGTVGASWNMSDYDSNVHIAGVQVDWKKTGEDCSNLRAGFVDTKDSDLAWNKVSGSYAYNSKKHISKRTTNIFSTFENPIRFTILNHGNCESCNNAYIYNITPIKRPFTVTLANAEPLKFLTAEGEYIRDNGDSTYLALSGAANDGDQQIIVYHDEPITFLQTIGGNVATPYTYLKSLSLVNGNSEKLVKEWGNDALNAHTIEATPEFLNTYKDYITFTQNNSYESFKNPAGSNFGLRGLIEFKPEFGYKDAVVKINVPKNENYGYFNISGTAYDLAETDEVTFHRGDILKLSTTMREGMDSLYQPSGFKLRAKMNKEDTSWAIPEIIVNYGLDGGTSAYLDTNKRLQYGYYEITPIFQRDDNCIKIRVKESDVEKFDTSYGALSTPFIEAYTAPDGTEYKDFIIYNKVVYGKIYSLAVKPKVYGTWYTTWEIPTSNLKYSSDVFFHEAANNVNDNVISLSINDEGEEDTYVIFSGKVLRERYNLKTGETGEAAKLATPMALVNFGTESAATNDNGEYTLNPIRAITSKAQPNRAIRYIVSQNGIDTIKEFKLYNTDTEQVTHSFTITSEDGKPVVEDRTINAKKYNTNTIINVENGSIISNIFVTHSQSAGQVIKVQGESVQLKAIVTEPGRYTKVEVVDGVSVETPNVEENVKDVKFVIYNYKDDSIVSTYDAEKNDAGEFVCDVPLSDASLPGNYVFLRVTTDRATSSYGQYDDEGNYIGPNDNEEFNTTTYSDVYTGLNFVMDYTTKIPVLQQIGMPIDVDFLTLPIVGNTGIGFEFPFVSLGVIQTDTSIRLYVGVEIGNIIDKAKNTHMTKYANTGSKEYYGDMFSIDDPIGTFTKGLKESYTETFKDERHAAKEAKKANNKDYKSTFGAATWKFNFQVGVYCEFMLADFYDENTGETRSEFCFAGMGGYVGVSGGFRLTWQFICPLIFIPAYFGLEVDANVLGFFGATKKETAPDILYTEAANGTVDFFKSTKKFNASVKVGANVQVYVGAGICGVAGFRGGITLSGMYLYEPSDLVSDHGFALTFKAGIWIDLFLFTVPLQKTFGTTTFGSFKEYADIGKDNGKAITKAKGMNAGSAFTLREPYSSDESLWLNGGIQPFAAFEETASEIIVANGYEHPDTELVKMDDGSVVLFFLDNDLSRASDQRTVLKYAIYNNEGWSDPVVVQSDTTADYQPSAYKMDNGKVMVSWISSVASNEYEYEPSDYLTQFEVFTAVVDTKKEADSQITELTQLTSDGYYDYSPISVYDDVTGDRAVYYVKTASDGTIEDMTNSYTNDCIIVYMLYSAEQGKWLFDEYYDNEVATPEDEEILIRDWKGQRFLSAPIPEFTEAGMTPAIVDFTAISYNGIIVYAYTIDFDSSNDTAYDKELFVQFYDFASHKTYVPVRLTDDNFADTMPQMVRYSSGDAAKTMLFWYRNEKQLAYIDLSNLIKYGTNPDGSILDEYLADKDEETEGLERLYSYVELPYEGDSNVRAMADYRVVAYENDLYVVWTEGTSIPADPNIEGSKDIPAREVYATALINDYDGRTEDPETDLSSAVWSKPYRLTYGGMFTDEPNVTIDANGNMMVLYNQYNQEITDDPNNPVIISDFVLKASYMEPCGSVDVTDIEISDLTPNANDKLTLKLSAVNNGLTKANGYTIEVYESKDGILGDLIEKIETNEILLPGSENIHIVEWTVPEDFDGMSISALAKEAGMDNISEFNTKAFALTPEYEISDVYTYQASDGYHVAGIIKNVGNTTSYDSHKLEILIVGPFGIEMQYTLDENMMSISSVGGIKPGESISFNKVLNISYPEIFDELGYIEASCIIAEGSKFYSDSTSIRILKGKPISFKFNGDKIPDTLDVYLDKAIKLDITCEPADLTDDLEVEAIIDDQSILSYKDGCLVGLNEGTTVVKLIALPYGNEIGDIEVTVKEQKGSSSSSGGGSIIKPNTVVKNPDGSTTTTKTDFNGTKIITTTSQKGVEVIEKTDKNGKVISTSITLPKCDAATLPEAFEAENKTISIKTVGETQLIIPIKNSHSGMVAVKINNDRTEEIIATSYIDDGKIIVPLKDDATIKIVDNSKLFDDVEANIWYENAINFVSARKIFNGTADCLFEPEIAMTRAMLTQALHNLEGNPKAKSKVKFDDADGHWAANSIAWASENGIVSGYDNRTFGADDEITREQLATMLYRYAKSPKATGSLDKYADKDYVSDYALNAMIWAVENGIITGVTDTTLDAKGFATRAQVATMIMRFISK